MQFTCRGNAETLHLIQFKYDIICKNTAKINLILKLQTHPCKDISIYDEENEKVYNYRLSHCLHHMLI